MLVIQSAYHVRLPTHRFFHQKILVTSGGAYGDLQRVSANGNLAICCYVQFPLTLNVIKYTLLHSPKDLKGASTPQYASTFVDSKGYIRGRKGSQRLQSSSTLHQRRQRGAAPHLLTVKVIPEKLRKPTPSDLFHASLTAAEGSNSIVGIRFISEDSSSTLHQRRLRGTTPFLASGLYQRTLMEPTPSELFHASSTAAAPHLLTVKGGKFQPLV
ncbi:unnamed protein product [Closterium sp. Yama58-4]|nr:unnamed protein product [Closterium sp. Yama58-4]